MSNSDEELKALREKYHRHLTRAMSRRNYFHYRRDFVVYRILTRNQACFIQDLINHSCKKKMKWKVAIVKITIPPTKEALEKDPNAKPTYQHEKQSCFLCTRRFLHKSLLWDDCAQKELFKELIGMGFLSVVRKGVPARRYVWINLEALEDAVDTAMGAAPIRPEISVGEERTRLNGCEGTRLQRKKTTSSNKGEERPKEEQRRRPTKGSDGGVSEAKPPVEEMKIPYIDQVPPPPPEDKHVPYWHPLYKGMTVSQLRNVSVDVDLWFPYPGYGVPTTQTQQSPSPEGARASEPDKKDKESPLWSRVAQESFPRQCTLVLYEEMKRAGHTSESQRKATKTWTTAFTKLYEKVQTARSFTTAQTEAEIRSVISWYIDNLHLVGDGESFIPEVYSGTGFCEKYDQIRAAIKRQHQKSQRKAY